MNININYGFFVAAAKTVVADAVYSATGTGRMVREAAGVSVVASAAGSAIAADYIADKTNTFAAAMNRKSEELAKSIMARHAQRANKLSR